MQVHEVINPHVLTQALKAKKDDNGYSCICPGHDDKNASLSISKDLSAKGDLILHCHAGCTFDEVLSGLKRHGVLRERTKAYSVQSKTEYIYTDEHGAEVHKTIRAPGKKFFQAHWDSKANDWINNLNCQRYLYRLPKLIEAVGRGEPVLIVEGEKDADNAHQLGLTATCNPMGAGKWRPKDKYNEYFNGATVYIVPDQDKPGIDHAQAVYDQLRKICNVHIVNPKVGKDFSEWLEKEPFTKDEFLAYADHNKEKVKKLRAEDIGLIGEIELQLNKSGKRALPVIENSRRVWAAYGVIIRYNVIKKMAEAIIPGIDNHLTDCKEEAELTFLADLLVRHELSKDMALAHFEYLAACNPYNPVLDWIKKKPWDGVDRIEEMCGTIIGIPPEKVKLSYVLMYRWFIQCIRVLKNKGDTQCSAVLIFQGGQYIGKTNWFRKLAPLEFDVIKDGLELRPTEKDSVARACSYWIAELGELDATFRKADIASLKAFLSMTIDVFRPPFSRKPSRFTRRTSFAASVNDSEFLQDRTGNRRYWVVELDDIADHDIDMQQFWAQILTIEETGEQHWLTKEENDMLSISNEDYVQEDYIESAIRNLYDWNSDRSYWSERTLDEIYKELGFDRPDKSQQTKTGPLIVKLSGIDKRRDWKRGGSSVYMLPALSSTADRLIANQLGGSSYPYSPL